MSDTTPQKRVAFESYGVKSIAPTMLANWDAAPATLILKRVFGVPFRPNAKMWRGDAVEVAMAALIRNPNEIDEVAIAAAVSLALETFEHRSMGEINEETEKEAALISPMIEQIAEYISDNVSEAPAATQLKVEGWLSDISIPFMGKVDFSFFDKSLIELKTTVRAPSRLETASLSHRWQAAIYAEIRQAPVTLLYITPKKHAAFEVSPGDESLKTALQTARAMERMFLAHDEGLDLLSSLPVVAGSFYWDEEMTEAYERALSGELPPLKGTGTEALLEQGILTFGKHAGKHISELPDKYLDWLLNPKLSDGGTYEVPEAIQEAIRSSREGEAA